MISIKIKRPFYWPAEGFFIILKAGQKKLRHDNQH